MNSRDFNNRRYPETAFTTGTVWRLLTITVAALLTIRAPGQEAIDVQPKPNEQPPPAASPSPPPPSLPELNALDQAFKETSLGEAADELRLRLELRKLENEIANDADIRAAKREADAAPTDLEKRDRLRAYYNLYYDRIIHRTSRPEMKAAAEKAKADHIALLSQPRVRPGSGPTPAPQKKKQKRRHGRF